MAANKVRYGAGNNAGPGRSHQLWDTFSMEAVLEDNQLGVYLWEDFLQWCPSSIPNSISGGTVLGNAVQYCGSSSGGWKGFHTDNTCTALGLTTMGPTGAGSLSTASGVVRFSTDSVDNNGTIMQGGREGASWGLPTSSGVLPKMFFEARVRFNEASAHNIFLGLAQGGLATGMATLIQDTTDTMVTTTNSIGFFFTNTANSVLFNYQAAAAPTAITQTGTLPSTLTNWTKLGFVIDPYDVSQIRIYQDGAQIGSLSSIPSTNWPSTGTVGLTPTIVVKDTAASQVVFDIDWIAIGQILSVD